jgi:hypothetical protein
VGNYLDILEGHFLIRRLAPWSANLGKRLVKTPKVYVRDSGLLHYLLGIRNDRDLLGSPRRGASWEGCLAEQIIALEKLRYAGSQFWFYRTQAGAEIDLVIERGGQRLGYEFTCATAVSRSDASGLRVGLADGVIGTGTVVYFGAHRYPLDERIEAVPAEALLRQESEPLRFPT